MAGTDRSFQRSQHLLPAFSGSCSEIYLEKCFQESGLAPAERLPVARKLGESSLMFLVHPTITFDQMAAYAELCVQWCNEHADNVGSCFFLGCSAADWPFPLLRRVLLVGVDALLLPLSVWLSFWLRLANPYHPSFQAAGSWLLLAVLLVGLPLYSFTGQYKGLTRYVGSAALYRLAARNGLLVLLLAAIGVMLRLPMPPRSSWILLWLLLTGFTGAVRFALRDVLLNLRSLQHNSRCVSPSMALVKPGPSWQLHCVLLGITPSSLFSTTTRLFGAVRSMVLGFNHLSF